MKHIYKLIELSATSGGTIGVLCILFLICFFMYSFYQVEAAKEFSNLILGCLLGIFKTEYTKIEAIKIDNDEKTDA